MTPGPLSIAVDTSLGSDVKPEYQGTAALARQYAELIDAAAPAARYRAALYGLAQAVRMLGTLGEPLAAAQAREHLDKIADALAAHSVASDLGPKLLAALTALGLTPAAVQAVRKEEQGDVSAPVQRPESQFERARRERAERVGQHGA